MAGYAEIAAQYRSDMDEGRIAPGDPMPTYAEVTARFQVNRTTAVRAYDVLKGEGRIGRLSDGRLCMAEESPVYRSGVARVDRIDQGGKGLLTGESAVEHKAGMRSVDDLAIAEALGVDLRDEIAVRTRVFVRDGKRRVYAVSCYHPRAVAVVPELPVEGAIPGEWHQLHEERTGRKVQRSPQRFSARIATPDELQRLHIPDAPAAAYAVLVASTVFHDEEGPLAFWEDVYAPGLSHVSKG